MSRAPAVAVREPVPEEVERLRVSVKELQKLSLRPWSAEDAARVGRCVDCGFTIQPGEKVERVPFVPAAADVDKALDPAGLVQFAARCMDCAKKERR